MRLLYTLLLVLIALGNTEGQERRSREERSREHLIPSFVETANFPSELEHKSRLDILFSIPIEFFVFVRTIPAIPSHQFEARAEITIELLDSAGGSVGRRFFSRTIGSVIAPEPTKRSDIFEKGQLSFDLSPGTYTLLIEIIDLESKRRFEEKRKVIVKRFFGSTLEISSMLFFKAALPAASQPNPVPLSFGGDIPFGTEAEVYFEIFNPVPSESVHVEYSLFRLRSATGKPELISKGVVSDTSHGQYSPIVTTGHETTFGIRNPPTMVMPMHFRLRADTLQPGAYSIEVLARAGSVTQSVIQKFRSRWLDMPRSLASLPVATKALSHIATTEEMSIMEAADPDLQQEMLEAFWKRRDPTPGTARNELMEEYYRRVDYAMEQYSTIQQPNGMSTDRGKAYILYGSPSSVERTLTPASLPTETWLYAGLKKKLVFIDQSRKGNYRLYSLEEL